jgi:uncharacterized protein (TIGR02271 family)
MNRTITALFDERSDADRAKSRLADLGVSNVNITSQGQGYGDDLTTGASSASTAVPTTGSTGTLQSSEAVQEVTDGDYDQNHDRDRARSGGGFWAGIKNFFSDDDRPAYEEGLRRGHFLLTAQVDDDLADEAVRILEESDAVDVDRRVEEWRSAGWTGTPASTMSTGYDADRAQTLRSDADTAIPIVEETLRVGKREVGRGGVRVRSYVVETPVNEQVSLHEEHVSVERRAVDQPLSAAADGDLFRERTIEMTETAEEAVVAKEARVREELVINKEVTDRTETISDTVRHTEVEVDDTRSAGGVTGEARGFTTTDTTTGSASTQGIDTGQGEDFDLIPGETAEDRRRRLSLSTGTQAGTSTGTGPGAGSL